MGCGVCPVRHTLRGPANVYATGWFACPWCLQGYVCFSADACPQFKLAWYQKDTVTGNWTNVWRTGKVSLGGVTGANQFANGKPQKMEGGAIEPQTVHPVFGNTVSVTDQMRAGLFIYTTDGLLPDARSRIRSIAKMVERGLWSPKTPLWLMGYCG